MLYKADECRICREYYSTNKVVVIVSELLGINHINGPNSWDIMVGGLNTASTGAVRHWVCSYLL